MKKVLSILLTLVMLLGITAIAPVTADAALNNTQISLYKAKLRHIYNNPFSYSRLFDDRKNIEKCSFTFLDLNSDGVDEMLVKFDQTYVYDWHTRVFTISNNTVKQIFTLGISCEFYKNNYIKVNWSHNHSPGDAIWPYYFGRVNGSSFSQIADVYCAEEGHVLADQEGGYYSYLDYDNDGIIYYINKQPYTTAGYKNYINTYMPAKNKLSVSWQKITNANINNLGNPTSVKLNRGTLSLGVGESYGLVKTVSPNFAKQSVSWTSSKSSVATVDKYGKVTGKKAGTATVTVKTSNGKTASCKVTVKAAPKSVKTNPASLKLGGGEKYTISESTSSGSYANAANLSWSTSNKTVAGVIKTAGTNKAVVAGLGYGNANVSVRTYNGKTASCKVTVYPAPTSVKLSKTSLTLKKGQSYTISESTNSGSYANAANLKWASANAAVAKVTKGSGNKATVKALTRGKTVIRITLYNGKTAYCNVTVK